MSFVESSLSTEHNASKSLVCVGEFQSFGSVDTLALWQGLEPLAVLSAGQWRSTLHGVTLCTLVAADTAVIHFVAGWAGVGRNREQAKTQW